MKDDFLQLSLYLEELSKEVSLISSEASKFYVKTLIEALVKFSPVDTSMLISNWVVTINSKTSNLLKPHHLGSKGSTTELSSTKTLFDAGIIINNIKSGDIVYISNISPQVIYTNYGTDRIPPRYFIERAIQLADRSFDTKFDVKLDAKR